MQLDASSQEQELCDGQFDQVADREAIHQLLQNWVIWRDGGDWKRFATVWHHDGRMNATWFRASAAEFIEGCKKGFDAGIIGLHSLGAISVDVRGVRAVAQCRMQIMQRGEIDGIEVDVTCIGRFVDALEKREGRWGIVLRQPVYEVDRMVPVNPGHAPELDQDLLNSFPVGYRHLAYLQSKVGFTVYHDLPGTRGPEIADLNARMSRWLDGASSSCLG
jgi:hypothetical protein